LSSRRRHTRFSRDWSSDVCSSDLGQVVVTRTGDLKRHRAIHGLTRSLVANMVEGVTKGFEKSLELKGVGYRAQKQGNKLVLAVRSEERRVGNGCGGVSGGAREVND